MDTKSYTYSGLNQIGPILFALTSCLSFIAGLFFLSGFFHFTSESKGDAAVEMFFLFIGLSIWSPIIYIFIGYLFSNIKTDNNGLYVNFLFRTHFVKWEDVLDIRPMKFFGIPTFGTTNIIVLKRGLTPFHRLYGIVYGSTPKPSFCISSQMRGHVELKHEIKQHIKNSHQKDKLFSKNS